MTKRLYRQYCPVAHALDLVGERWSLLVVRELQHGPARYTDLHARLDGCSTNILAERLRDLEAGGVIERRVLPAPAASTVYELTALGRGLQPVVHELARWGARTLGPPPPDAELAAGWLERALRTAVAGAAPEDACIAFRCGDEEATIVGGRVVPGVADEAHAVVESDPIGLYHALVDGDLSRAAVDGDDHEVLALASALRADPAAAPPG